MISKIGNKHLTIFPWFYFYDTVNMEISWRYFKEKGVESLGAVTDAKMSENDYIQIKGYSATLSRTLIKRKVGKGRHLLQLSTHPSFEPEDINSREWARSLFTHCCDSRPCKIYPLLPFNATVGDQPLKPISQGNVFLEIKWIRDLTATSQQKEKSEYLQLVRI